MQGLWVWVSLRSSSIWVAKNASWGLRIYPSSFPIHHRLLNWFRGTGNFYCFIMWVGKAADWVYPKEGSCSAMVGKNTRRSFHLLVGATLTIATSVVGSFLTSSLTSGEQSWWLR